MKRIFDVLFSILALLAFAPFLFLIGIVHYFCLGSPLFFRQIRPGFKGKPFLIIKLRTMSISSEKNIDLRKDAERLTPFGNFLRKYSLDEIPEFWNVLIGDMSIVGPRPLLMEYLPLYSKHQARRHEVRPGITGWAQVNGRNAISWSENLDMMFGMLDNQNLALDIKIIWMTFLKVIKKEGIAYKGHVTTEKFQGNK